MGADENMAYTKNGWVKTSADVYDEGVYYKVNHALIVSKDFVAGWNLTLRNTYTGKEEHIGYFRSKTAARRAARDMMRGNIK